MALLRELQGNAAERHERAAGACCRGEQCCSKIFWGIMKGRGLIIDVAVEAEEMIERCWQQYRGSGCVEARLVEVATP